MNETLTRALSGAVYILLLLTCLLYSDTTFYLLFGLFLALAVLEFCKLVQLRCYLPMVLTILVYGGACFFSTSHAVELVALILTIGVSFKLLLFLFSKHDAPHTLFEKWLYVIGYLILPFVLITKIPMGINGYNPKIILGVFILIWTNDTWAYIIGKSIGRHKLFERISPKKTKEGFIGGFVVTVGTSVLIASYFIGTSNLKIWIGIGILVSIFATLGDLIQSKFKRLAGVKDSGKIMPGHGGILDRLDSIIFVSPFIFLFYQILKYVS